jgi:hypothetical protein
MWLRGAEFVCGWLEESRITVNNGKSRTGNLVVRCVVDLCRNVYLAYSSLRAPTGLHGVYRLLDIDQKHISLDKR